MQLFLRLLPLQRTGVLPSAPVNDGGTLDHRAVHVKNVSVEAFHFKLVWELLI